MANNNASASVPNRSRRSPANAGQRSSGVCRPRTIGTLLLVCIGTVLLLPSSNRSAAHSALSKAGVPIPNKIPDRIHDFLDSWNSGYDNPDLDYVPSPAPPEDNEYWVAGSDMDGDVSAINPDIDGPYGFNEQNGHLEMKALSAYPKPPKPHPILTLIRKAEQKWKRKVARQSKTLKEASAEYRRRYKRNPPKGFDEWWKYAKQNQIVLTDEYDQIFHDIEPFWALCVDKLLRHMRALLTCRAENLPI